MLNKKLRRKAVLERTECVACGCCVKVCPKQAIHIEKGIFADIDLEKCVGGGKGYCNRYCGRGQLLSLLGGRFGLSSKKDPPRFLRSKWFRYGFLIFFFIMFFQMLWNTWLLFEGAQNLRQMVTILWMFKLPWHWAYHGTIGQLWIAQFAFGFYSVMLTSTILGILTMALFKPRSWCVYCPMGTMTQLICRQNQGKV